MKKFKDICKKIWSYQYTKWFVVACVLAFFCDILNQLSVWTAVVRLFTKPLNFLFNAIILLVFISLAGLFKHRKFALMLICLPWVVLAIANFVMQFFNFRQSPIDYEAIRMMFDGSIISIFNKYLDVFAIVLIVIGVIVVIAGLVFLYRKEAKKERALKQSIIGFLATLLFALLIRFPLISIGSISDDYSNTINAYKDYGMPYCFVVSFLDRGVDKPDRYDKKLVEDSLVELDDLMKQLNKQPLSSVTINSDQKPNIIFLQLESFMDPNYILNVDYSQNPVPYYSYLKENYPSGVLNVPTFGAGTANVEFEIMTGLNLNFFGPGEYPYNSVLSEQTTESIAYNLKNYGYYATAIHNNRATFYNRDDVFKNLGYDRFVTSEFMIDLEYTQVGWAKDACLSYEIMKALKSSEGSDYIYTISVQPHGKYLTDIDEIKNKTITCKFNDGSDNDDLLSKYTYYVNQVYEVDLFLKDLIDQLNSYDEPTMLVLYGDHLPNIEFEDKDLYLKDKYKSEYVIWSNFDTNLKDKELYTYHLSSYILENIGCTDGIINKLHQTRELNENYMDMYLLFEYDMFSDEKYLWGGTNPYKQAEGILGYDDTIITSITFEGGAMIVHGENFTQNSKVYFGKEKQDTVYKDSKTLVVDVDELKSVTKITVKQVSSKNVVYSVSNVYEYKKN